MRRPNRLARAMVDVALLALPAGELRHRYERELPAELYGLPAGRQLRYAAGTLTTAWSLRNAATGRTNLEGATMTVATPRKPLLCMLNLRHHYVRDSTEDGELYYVCDRCGKDRPENQGGGGSYPGAAAAGGGVMGG